MLIWGRVSELGWGLPSWLNPSPIKALSRPKAPNHPWSFQNPPCRMACSSCEKLLKSEACNLAMPPCPGFSRTKGLRWQAGGDLTSQKMGWFWFQPSGIVFFIVSLTVEGHPQSKFYIYIIPQKCRQACKSRKPSHNTWGSPRIGCPIPFHAVEN